MKNKILPIIFSILLGTGAMAQNNRIGQHDPVGRWQTTTSNFASSAEGRQIAQEIIDVIGLKPNFEVQAGNVPNAAAVVYGGKRYVLYNPTFIDRLIKTTGTRWAAVSVLAHEIGHHLNGHTIGGTGSQPKLELEADEFSGFVLRKMGASLQEAQVAMKVAAGERASKTHPGQNDRLVAIQKGWQQADDQLNGRNIARNTPVQAPAPAPRQQPAAGSTTGTMAGSAISARHIIGDVRFNADPSSRYYVTTQYNLVKVVNNQLSVIGKLANSNSSRFPYVIYDNNTQLLVDTQGNILTQRGQQVGVLRGRA